MSISTHGVEPKDAGVASAMISSSQQVGGSIGTALLNTIATSSAASYLVSHGGPAAQAQERNEALMHGYSVAYWLAVGFVVAAAARLGDHGERGRSEARTGPGGRPRGRHPGACALIAVGPVDGAR